MKKLFSGYYRTDSIDWKKILKESIIVFDTEVLLDFYRMPVDISDSLIECIKNSKLYIWLPYIIANQYHLGIDPTLQEEMSKQKEKLVSLDKLRENLNGTFSYIFNDPNDLDKINKNIESARIKVLRNMVGIKEHYKRSSTLRNKIADTFNHNIGSLEEDTHPFSIKDNTNNCVSQRTEVNSQYVTSSQNSKEIFGQYEKIIFKTLIKKSKQEKKPILFVVNQHMERFFLMKTGKSYGPNPSLATYFSNKTEGQDFYCFVTPVFFKNVSSIRCEIQNYDSVLKYLKHQAYKTQNEKESYETNWFACD